MACTCTMAVDDSFLPDHRKAPVTARSWIVEATVEARVTLASGDVLERDDFHAWLWEAADGLLGIDEGSVDAVDAAARGLVPAALVIDAAAAPADRDWVATLPVAATAWWFADEAAARAAVSLVAEVRGCRVRGLHVDDSSDHEAASRASFGPIDVPGFGVVRPAWDEGAAGLAADGAATIFIEPGLGFGTGLHPTTQLCLAALARTRRCGGRLDRVLDYGSGSGILGIAAAVLGARQVDAIEIDERVHPAIVANARRNGVAARLRVAVAAAPDAPAYDVVMANIVPQVLLDHAVDLCDRLDPRRGTVVLSGFFAADVPRITALYSPLLGCRPSVHDLGDWRCLSFTRD